MRPAALLLALLAAGCGATGGGPELRDGDLIFQTSQSAQSVAIQRATHSRYSHMGMIVLRNHRPFVLEASATVRLTALDTWTAGGAGRHFVVKRLRASAGTITPEAMGRARALLPVLMGRAYDTTFEWSDDRMYCSELVWKIYQRALGIRIGELQQLREFDLTDPAVRAKLGERYGDHVPLSEPVISPAAMFDSPVLEEVLRR